MLPFCSILTENAPNDLEDTGHPFTIPCDPYTRCTFRPNLVILGENPVELSCGKRPFCSILTENAPNDPEDEGQGLTIQCDHYTRCKFRPNMMILAENPVELSCGKRPF